MKKIIFTKIYELDHTNGLFKIYVSEHDTGLFYGGVLYYNKKVSESNGERFPDIEIKLEQFIGGTEQGAYNQCEEWVKKNLPGKYKIKLLEEKRP